MLSREGHIGMELLAEKEAISAGSRRHSTYGPRNKIVPRSIESRISCYGLIYLLSWNQQRASEKRWLQ